MKQTAEKHTIIIIFIIIIIIIIIIIVIVIIIIIILLRTSHVGFFCVCPLNIYNLKIYNLFHFISNNS